MEGLIWSALKSNPNVRVLCMMTQTDAVSLSYYIGSYGLTFPFGHAAESSIFDLYHVGFAWGQLPPAWFVIDQNGMIQMRLDNAYDQVEVLKSKMEQLLSP